MGQRKSYQEYTRAYSHYLKTIAPEEENTLEADFTEDGGYIRMYTEANSNVEKYSRLDLIGRF